MLHYEALRQLTHEHQRQRQLEAQAERLALQARGRRQWRRRLLGLSGLLTADGATGGTARTARLQAGE
jgi:hypothetical protein